MEFRVKVQIVLWLGVLIQGLVRGRNKPLLGHFQKGNFVSFVVPKRVWLLSPNFSNRDLVKAIFKAPKCV